MAASGPAYWEVALPIIYRVCDNLNVSPIAVLSVDRHHPLPTARQLIGWLLHRRGWLGWQISFILGVDVSTVYYYIHNVERRRRMEYGMAAQCARLISA